MYRLIYTTYRKDGLKVEYYDLSLDGPSRQDTQVKTYVDVAEGPHRHKLYQAHTASTAKQWGESRGSRRHLRKLLLE